MDGDPNVRLMLANTVRELKDLRLPGGFTPVVGFRRFGIPWPPISRENDHLVQRGHLWTPRASTVAECKTPNTKNCGDGSPFGGYKQSGIGRERGLLALQNYTQVKNVVVRVGRSSPRPESQE